MSKKKLILIGGGGHCKSVIDAIESCNDYLIEGILDLREQVGNEVLGYPVIGTDDDLEKLNIAGRHFLITIGQIRSAARRQQMYACLVDMNAEIATIVAATAQVSRHAILGAGTVVLHGATVNAGAVVGSNNIINTGSNVEHDVRTGDHCHISTHAVLNGSCNLGEAVFAGSNSVIAHGISIADRAIIGAGTVVHKNISEPGTYVGNPFKKIA